MTDFVWPPENTQPTEEMPFYSSGEYSADPLNVSPEGNVYGHERCMVMDPKAWRWIGDRWVEIPTDKGSIVPTGQVNAAIDLPAGPRPYREIWQVRFYNKEKNEYYWVEYFWSAEDEEWKPLNWLWPVDTASALPTPGHFAGEAHWVLNWHQKYRWVGIGWQKPRHSEMHDDEPQKHLPVGFLQLLRPDLELVFVSPKEIGIEASEGGSGTLFINREWVKPGPDASVFNTMPCLELNSQTDEIWPFAVVGNTEYWIYLANSQFPWPDGFRSAGVSPVGLFLSRSEPENGFLSRSGAGRNARLVGKIQTDSSSPPRFLKEQNLSLISRVPSLPEALRQQSDFVLEFLDQDNLILRQLDDTHGEIAIASKLYCLDSDCIINRHDPWIEWNDSVPDRVVLHENEELTPNQLYYVYLPAGDIDAFNFNQINPNTKRPWDETDDGAETHYDPDLDLRLWPFLSPQEPDHGRLSEQAPGWYTRHIGQVVTDANGRFRPSTDLSAIRQPTLNPTNFDGLAEIRWSTLNPEEFIVAARKGTSGVVMVGGEAVQCYESSSPFVHQVNSSDPVWEYNESAINDPLSEIDPISSYPQQQLYVYLANSRGCWGANASQLFVSNEVPEGGYLSRNWPGNQARWIGTIVPDPLGRFSGTYVIESVATDVVRINDWSMSVFETWSSEKIATVVDEVRALISTAQGYAAQQTSGIHARLAYQDDSHVLFLPTGMADLTVIFPDLTYRTIPAEGLTLEVAGLPQTLYYCYLGTETCYLSADGPTETLGKLSVKGNDILIGYVAFAATDYLDGTWNVYSAFNQETRAWSGSAWNGSSLQLAKPGLVIPPGIEGQLSRTGYTTGHASAGSFSTSCSVSAIHGSCSNSVPIGQTGLYLYVSANVTPSSPVGTDGSVPSGIYDTLGLSVSVGCSCYGGCSKWATNTGAVSVTVPGNV